MEETLPEVVGNVELDQFLDPIINKMGARIGSFLVHLHLT